MGRAYFCAVDTKVKPASKWYRVYEALCCVWHEGARGEDRKERQRKTWARYTCATSDLPDGTDSIEFTPDESNSIRGVQGDWSRSQCPAATDRCGVSLQIDTRWKRTGLGLHYKGTPFNPSFAASFGLRRAGARGKDEEG